jgi:hypothetical protein
MSRECGRPRTFIPGALDVALELRALLPRWSWREIAELLDVPAGTLRARVYEAGPVELHKSPVLSLSGVTV